MKSVSCRKRETNADYQVSNHRSIKSSILRKTDKSVCVRSRQTSSAQSQPETPLQSELLPELTGGAQSPPPEHMVTPPSTVDTAALSEEPLPGEGRCPHLPDVCVRSYVDRKCESNRKTVAVVSVRRWRTQRCDRLLRGRGLVSLTTDLRVKFCCPPHSSFNPYPSQLPQLSGCCHGYRRCCEKQCEYFTSL